jgi:hypothetical protein
MSPDTGHPAGDGPSEPITVRVEHDAHGRWSVAMPNRSRPVSCETFDDARRVAYLCAAHTRLCDLIVHDAYHRVLHRELITGHQEAGPSPPMPGANRPTH